GARAGGLADGLREPFQLAGDVRAGGLVGDLAEAGGCELLDPVAHLSGRSGERQRWEQTGTLDHRRLIPARDADEMLFVNRKVAALPRNGLDRLTPAWTTGHRVPPLWAAALIQGVEDHGDAVTGGVEHPLVGRLLPLLEDGAERQHRPPRWQPIPGRRSSRAEHTVSQLLCHGV